MNKVISSMLEQVGVEHQVIGGEIVVGSAKKSKPKTAVFDKLQSIAYNIAEDANENADFNKDTTDLINRLVIIEEDLDSYTEEERTDVSLLTVSAKNLKETLLKLKMAISKASNDDEDADAVQFSILDAVQYINDIDWDSINPKEIAKDSALELEASKKGFGKYHLNAIATKLKLVPKDASKKSGLELIHESKNYFNVARMIASNGIIWAKYGDKGQPKGVVSIGVTFGDLIDDGYPIINLSLEDFVAGKIKVSEVKKKLNSAILEFEDDYEETVKLYK